MEEQKSDYANLFSWKWLVLFILIGVCCLVYYIFFYGNNEVANNNYQPPLINTVPKTEPVKNDAPISTNIKNYMIQNMKVEILKEGTGVEAKSGDNVTVNYTGTLTDGTKFDSSLNPGRQPFEFTIDISSVISGWHLGVNGMKVGEKRKLTIPPDLAYGAGGRPPVIPPSATLIFDIELLKIN